MAIKGETHVLKTSIGRFRVIGMLEGLSFLILLAIAMPLKYLAGIEEAVLVVGWAHGILFISYVLALLQVTIVHRWSFLKLVGGFIASLLPFGPFIFDAKLKKEIA